MSLNLANSVTLGRVFLIPVIFWLMISGHMQWAAVTFVVAGASDAVDGYLAKNFDQQTTLGAYLDPMADKLLIVSVYIALGTAGHLPLWLVIGVVSRDILIVLGVLLLRVVGQPLTIRPLIVSKANTAAQIVLAATVLGDEGFGLGLGWVRTALVWITGILTLLSLAGYIKEWLRLMSGDGAAGA